MRTVQIPIVLPDTQTVETARNYGRTAMDARRTILAKTPFMKTAAVKPAAPSGLLANRKALILGAIVLGAIAYKAARNERTKQAAQSAKLKATMAWQEKAPQRVQTLASTAGQQLSAGKAKVTSGIATLQQNAAQRRLEREKELFEQSGISPELETILGNSPETGITRTRPNRDEPTPATVADKIGSRHTPGEAS